MVQGSNVVMGVGFSPFFHSASRRVGFASGISVEATRRQQQHLSGPVTVAEECHTLIGGGVITLTKEQEGNGDKGKFWKKGEWIPGR